MNTLRMYTMLVRASIRSRMQYKFNFIFSSVLSLVTNLMEFSLIAIVLLKFGHIKGWSLNEVGYLYGVLVLSRAIYRITASDVHRLERYLISGDLDQLLIRPIPILLALMTQNFSILLGEALQGITITAVCIRNLLIGGQITLWAVPETFVIIMTGAVILFTIGLMSATTGFWITRTSDLQNITEDASRNAAQYPLVIYPDWLKYVLLTIIPVGFVNYMPSLYILRGELGWWILPATALFAGCFFALGLGFWTIGLKRYHSTGS